MTFKEQLKRDAHAVFLNTNEFADVHRINGRMMAALIDSSEAAKREKRYVERIDGMYAQTSVLYVAADDYGPLPSQGSRLELDGRPYLIEHAAEEDALYVLTISANRGRGR